MSWQDRDYARDEYSGPGRRRGRGIRGLWGGSVVNLLIVLNVGLHLLAAFTATREGSPIYNWGVMQGFAVLERGQVWRILTATYLHAPGWMHIVMNMVGLSVLGRALEQRWGGRKFFAIYTISGLLGNLALLSAVRWGWFSMGVPALGASGCVLGLLGAAAVMFPHAEVLVYFLFPVRIRTAAIVFGLMYLYNIRLQGSNFGGDICHLAGLLFGAWWAWRGDRWWTGTRFAWPSLRWPRFGWKRKPDAGGEPRVWSGVGRGPWGKKVRERAADQQTVDRILAKVYERGGIGALTPEEHRTLREATERLQEAERRAE